MVASTSTMPQPDFQTMVTGGPPSAAGVTAIPPGLGGQVGLAASVGAGAGEQSYHAAPSNAAPYQASPAHPLRAAASPAHAATVTSPDLRKVQGQRQSIKTHTRPETAAPNGPGLGAKLEERRQAILESGARPDVPASLEEAPLLPPDPARGRPVRIVEDDSEESLPSLLAEGVE